MSLLSALQGKKTYITAAAGVLATVAAVSGGQLSPMNGLVAALLLGAQAFNRAGSKTDAAKVIEKVGSAADVAVHLAPIAGALDPKLSGLADQIGQVASTVEVIAARTAPAAVEQPTG